MSKFNLENYETVKERKKRFYKDHVDGRIMVEMINEDLMEKAVFKATIYLNADDQKNNLPKSTGYALEVRDTELSTSKYGKEYESVNYSSWTENCEESAVGRALDNAGYAGTKTCSREEMEKVGRMNKTMKKYNKSNKATPMTDAQETLINKLIREDRIPDDKATKLSKAMANGEVSKAMASKIIDKYINNEK